MATKKKKTWQELLAEFQNDNKNYTEPASEKFYQGWLKGGAFRDGYQVGDLLKTYAGTYQDVHKNAWTAVLDATENLIDAGAIGVGTVGGLFNKDFQKRTDQFVAKDLLQSKNTANWIVDHVPYDPLYINLLAPALTGENYEDDSLLGEKADSMLQSLAHQAGAMGLQAAGVPWQIPTAVNAFVPEYENAINQGASHREAMVSGSVSAGAEVGTEMLFKGSGMLDEVGLVSLDKLTSSIKNKAVKAIMDYGVDVAAEGFEEVISQFASSLGSLVYEAEDPSEILDILADKNSFNNSMTAFISGGVMAGFGNAGNVVNSVKTGTDYRTGLNAMEQSVYDAVLEQNMKDYEAENGKIATGKAKDKVAAATIEQLQKGGISTDIIGKTLARDAYGQYQQVNEQISKLQPEYDQLYNMKPGEKSDAQADRQKELKQQLDDLKQKRQDLDSRMEAVTKGTQLEESYRERSRRGQAFQADSTRYENKHAQQTVQNIMESGVVNNTNRTHEFVDFLANVSAHIGKTFSATDAKRLKDTGYAIDGVVPNGSYSAEGITININSPKALNAVVGHEVTHALKGSEMFDALSSSAVAYAKAKGTYNSRMAALRKIYKGKPGYETDFDAKVQEELVADIIGDHLFTDEDFVRHIVTQDRNLFQKIFDEVKHLVTMATPGSKEARQLEKLKHTFEKVWNETKNTAQQQDGVKYSINPKFYDQLDNAESDQNVNNEYAIDSSGTHLTPGQQKYFADSKIRNQNGNLKVMYHGSPDSFTVFDRKKARSNGYYGSGFYFTDSDSHARQYGNAYKVYLNIRSPLQNEAYQITKPQLQAFVEALAENEDYGLDNYGYNATIESVVNSVWGKSDFAMLMDLNASCVGNMVEAVELFNDVNGTDYDGIVAPTETVAFYPNQIKNVNNLNPTANEDIRYSLSESENESSKWNISGEDIALGPADQDVPAEQPITEGVRLTHKAAAEIAKEIKISLGVPNNRMYEVHQLIEAYANGKISGRDELHQQLKENFGMQQERIVNDDVKQVRDYLRNYRLQVSDSIKSEIADFRDLMRRNRGRIIFSRQGTPVDIAYQEMATEFPNFFPEDVYSPTDQLLRILDVANEDMYNTYAYPIDDETMWGVTDDVVEYIDDIRNMTQATAVTEHLDAAPQDTVAEILGEEESYVSSKASELYEELTNLKKGVRASNLLGYVLDSLPEQSGSLKTALLNIRDNPLEVVNPRSKAESIARDILTQDYRDSLAELEQMQVAAQKPEAIKTAKDRLMTKIYNAERERLANVKIRQQSYESYNQDIADIQSRYDQLSNKNTLTAKNLLQQIERKRKLRDNNDAVLEKKINDLSERIVKMGTEEYRASAQRQLKHDEYYAWTEKLVGDTSTWKDKKTGWGYMTNTLRRNLRAIVKDSKGNPDYAKADAIYEELQGNYNRHEAEMNRELTKLRGKYADMKITKAEDAYIQMLGELRHNPQTELSLEKVEEFYEANKAKIDKKKVDQIIDMARQDYDDLIKRVNAVLKEQGIKEIPYRKGYFPHFTLDKQGPLAKLLNWKTRNDDIPTDIAGLTEQFEPVRSYQHFDKKRVSDTTDYSFTKGFDQYSFGAMDWIYHIEDIQKRRALEGYIRYTHSDEGVKAKIDAIKSDETLDADEAQKQMDMVYEEARNPLNNFVIDLRRGTQTLAAKKSSLDREMEYSTNRRIYSTMTNISNRVSANMVAGSVSAALTNFIPITQSWGTVSPIQSMQAMADTMRSAVRDDGTIDRSAFLTNRLRKAENLNKTGWDKASDNISLLMNAVDSFTSQTVWRSKFNDNISNGMSESESIRDADRFAEAVLAGRSRGNMPTIIDSKNPLIKTITAFQLEVANQYGYLFQDMPQEQKNRNIARLTWKYAEVFVGAYVYNSLFKAMTGRTAAFDPIRIIQELLQDVLAAADDDDEEDMAWSEVAGNFAENVLQEIPFVGGLLGGGRVPISSALPYDGLLDAFTGTIKDIEERDFKSLTKEWLNPVAYALMPMAGGQLKKTIEGLGMFLGDKPVTGSYTASGDLRYEVEPTPGNILQAGLFGQWANKNAQEYIEQGRKPLSEKQTEEFVELDIPVQQYWDIRDHLNRIDRSDSKTKTAEKIDYINSLGLSIEQQNVLVNNLLDRKEPVDMTDYDKFGSWAEFDFYIKNPEKHTFLKDNDIPYRLYSYDKDAYNWAFENQSKYAVSKAFLVPYTQYYAYRQNINAIQSLKDSSGKTVSGSQKKLRIKYINSLPITNLEKALLIKQYYPSETANDQFIADYLNVSYGLTAAERYRILYELGLQQLWEGGS